MRLELRFFATLREMLACEREQVEVPASVQTVGELRAWLRERGGVWAEALAEGRPVRAALDQAMVGSQAMLHENAEVAFFPPVTGG